jgi:hypothetical protein
MRIFLWYLGRTLQILALVQVGAALLIGLQSQDVKLELTLLTLGAIQFLIGVLLLKGTSQA